MAARSSAPRVSLQLLHPFDSDLEARALLARARMKLPDDVPLRRVAALELAVEGRRSDAIKLVADTEDAESRVLVAELLAPDDPARALDQVSHVSSDGLDPRVAWQVIDAMCTDEGVQSVIRHAQQLPFGRVDRPWVMDREVFAACDQARR